MASEGLDKGEWLRGKIISWHATLLFCCKHRAMQNTGNTAHTYRTEVIAT
jgi:hypothetical protein